MWSLAMPPSPSLGCAHVSTADKVHSVRCNHQKSELGSSFCVTVPLRPASLHGTHVLCQAHPRRVAKVSKQIEREIGQLMLTDKVLMDVTQSRSSDADKKGSLCSCSGVHVTNDLQVVKVYMSVLTDDESVKQRVLSRLSGLSGYVRRQIGERVRLRLTPEVRFVHDEAVERGERVLSLLKKIESGEDESATASSAQINNKSGQGFWEDDADVRDESGITRQKNPFLEGVGDSDYDSEDESEASTFFSADMFPDASPVLDDIAAQKRQTEWKGSNAKTRFRLKGGKAVRK